MRNSISVALLLITKFFVLPGNAQQLGDVFSVENVLGKNPAGNKTTIHGPGINLRSNSKYLVIVNYKNPGSDYAETYRRVIVHKGNDSIKDCSISECWKALHQFSDKDGDTTYTLQGAERILITSWSTSSSMTRGGDRPDEQENLTEVTVGSKKGIKIIFISNAGVKTEVVVIPYP